MFSDQSEQSADNSPHNEGSLPHSEGRLPHNAERLPHSESSLNDGKLLMIAAPARKNSRLSPEMMRKILCENRYLSSCELAGLLNRDRKGIQNRYLGKMVEEGILLAKFEQMNHPEQAYTAAKSSPEE